MTNPLDVASIIVSVVTASAAMVISYLLQKPYVRVVKMFRKDGTQDRTTYKLKNAGAATAISVVLQDRFGEAIDLDVRLGQTVRSVDALSPGAEITIGVPGEREREPVCAYYENLFGLLFRTELRDGANRFLMSGQKAWRLPPAVRSEMPHHRWRRG